MIFMVPITEEVNSAISEIYNRYHKRLLYTASQILGNERGEEAVHEVFLNIIDRIEKNPDFLRDKSGQYFVIIVKNHSINKLNREKREQISLDETTINDDIDESLETNPERLLLKKEADERLAVLIRQLSVKARQVLEYRFIEGYSNIEIAEILGISQTAVSSRIDRGKKQLRKLLEERGER